MLTEQILAEIAAARAELQQIRATEGLSLAEFQAMSAGFVEVLALILAELDSGNPDGAAVLLRRALQGYSGRPAGAVLQ